jgi:hypothetical protein
MGIAATPSPPATYRSFRRMPHRFEDFTDDFATWVIFYGPEGGERPR